MPVAEDRRDALVESAQVGAVEHELARQIRTERAPLRARIGKGDGVAEAHPLAAPARASEQITQTVRSVSRLGDRVFDLDTARAAAAEPLATLEADPATFHLERDRTVSGVREHEVGL